MATRQNLDLSITVLRDRFCNPQLQELHVLKLEIMKFDSKTDTPENFLVTLQTKATKALLQILQLLLQLIHMQQMLLLNKLGLTKIQRVAQK